MVLNVEWNKWNSHVALRKGSGNMYIGSMDELDYEWDQYKVIVNNSVGKVVVKNYVEGYIETLGMSILSYLYQCRLEIDCSCM